jgi:serine/threonine protein kinase
MMKILITSIAVFLVVARASVPRVLDADLLTIGRPLGKGSFGSVFHARLGPDARCVAKRASISAKAAAYLSVEEHVNRVLHDESASHHLAQSRHLAPFRGACEQGGHRYLVWDECGSLTLEECLRDGEDGLAMLAHALRCERADLPRVVLRELLEGLAHVHAHGVVHRDVKPENVLVDPSRRSLVLLDFGSACDVAAWMQHKGLEADHVPCSVLYCPPEQLLDLNRAPYTYDVYSAALIWLRVAVPSLTAAEQPLYDLRLELKSYMHDPRAWHAGTAALPEGFDREFDADGPNHRQQAWDLLCSLLTFNPTDRPCAADALLGDYLNSDCFSLTVPLPAPRPWTLEAAMTKALDSPPKHLDADECILPDSPQI